MSPIKILLSIVLFVCAVMLGVSQHNSHPTISNDLEFQRIDGEKQLFADFRGKPLLVTFWSPNCVICLREVTHLNQLYAEKQGGRSFQLLGVSMVYDRPDHVLETSRKVGMQYPVYFDLHNTVGRAFGDVKATPTSFLIDAEGNIVLKLSGKLDFELIEKSLNQLIV